MSSSKEAMQLLASHNAIFIGQNVCYDGAWPYADLEGVPSSQRVEFPVAEELQLGASIGLSLQGFLVVSLFPRMDFLMRAMDQLVNHLDKLATMSRGQFVPKVIIRTRVGPKKPLNAGPQHTQDHTNALRLMLTNTYITKVERPELLVPTYQEALERDGSSLIVENLPCS